MKWVLITIALIFLLIVGIGGGVTLYVGNALLPTAASAVEVKVSIPSGSSPREIAKMLELQGVIRSSTIFTYYLRYHNEGSKFQAGEYAMHAGMTLPQIIEMLNS